jgi:tetratricopeptide (TPR) repeat protein
MDVLRKARIVFPGVAPFQKLFDSLDALQRASRSARLDQINTLADQGRDQEATEAMEALIETDPREPALAIAQEALHARIQKRRGRIQIAELSRSCDLAVQGGDLTKAEAVYANLKKAGADGSESDRLRQRIDSLGAASRSGNAFSTAMVSSRQALKAGDVASARAFLQKALTVQPDNIVAKGLLGSLANVRTGNGASTNGLTTTNAPKSVKAPPSTEDGTRAKELLLAGVAAYRSGQYAKAVESWKQVRALDPTNIQAQKYLANVGLKQTRLK